MNKNEVAFRRTQAKKSVLHPNADAVAEAKAAIREVLAGYGVVTTGRETTEDLNALYTATIVAAHGTK